MRSIVVVLALAASAFAVRHDGFRVLRTQILDGNAAAALRPLLADDNVDFWVEPNPGRPADIMVSPENLPALTEFLANAKIDYKVMIDDVEEIVEEGRQFSRSLVKRRSTREFNWDDYQSFDQINAYIQGLADANPDWIQVESIGKTHEQRDMNVVKLTKAGPGKPNVWIDAGIHAREWISPAVTTYILNELVTKYDSDKDIARFVDNLNIHILPVANPDGYEFSRTDNRMWRKNRAHIPLSLCRGVDLNRNFDHHWGESGVGGKCSESYPGQSAFSEPETQNIKKYVESLDPVPVLAHSMHSYSQLWLWPYGYAYDAYPDNKEELKKLAEDAADALKTVHGTVFDPINSADLYPAAGASDDWYKGVLGARYAFTTELRDTGRYGFILPAKQIIPSGEEMMAAMRIVFDRLLQKDSP